MKLPILYKPKSKKIMQWWIEYDKNSYTVFHGYIDGKIQQTTTAILEGKNLGKKNQTSIEQQTELEAKALWQKQKDRKGYSPNINQDKPLMPMLAHKWEDFGEKLSFPLYIQRKYDGCLTGDSLIYTKEYGYKPISWIVNNKINCKVKSFNFNSNKIEYQKITHHFKNKNVKEKIKWFEIILETGEKLVLTGDHMVFLPCLNCWRRVDSLKKDEILMVL